ncbi:3'(2'),5'-bisphosphate nucleotidase CysQ [Maribellus mangrovi]|uniref:3'(2'),5'-bisphosphate nucleotidase CysQ n=1 Tax=Maribellus mangrovi TaxID=3133146 RepID=UPI0030EB676F
MDSNQQEDIFKLLAKAGKAIVEVYNSDNFEAELKKDNSPVTRADKASSRIINEGLKSLFPEIPVLDEETSIPDYVVRSKWEKYFLVDPLDGTKEFIKQNGEFCINLALIEGTSPVLGWIYQPLTKTGWFCAKGEGIVEFSNGEVHRIEKPEIKRNVIRIAASRSFFKPHEAELIEKMKQHYQIDILHCGSSKKQVQMVKGNADMYLKAGPCSEWDTAPGQLMVEEFGGAVLRHDNFKTLQYNRKDLLNPYFVMLNERLNTPAFIDFMKLIIRE